jgi:hypothetical protein
MSDRTDQDYIGDGVYACIDGGYAIRLSAQHEFGEHEIFLEPQVMDALVRYYERIKAKYQQQRDANS